MDKEESLYYEAKKRDDSYPIIGVNTFRNPRGGAVRVCSLGRITHALFEVGGQYRRSM